MADIVAHMAFQSVARIGNREFCWDWFKEHLNREGPLPM